jgi:hypothetical protein
MPGAWSRSLLTRLEVYALYLSRSHTPQRVRAFLDFAVPRLRARLRQLADGTMRTPPTSTRSRSSPAYPDRSNAIRPSEEQHSIARRSTVLTFACHRHEAGRPVNR